MCSSNDRKAFITVRVEAKNLRSEGCPRKNAEIHFFFLLLVFELHDKRPRKSRNKVVYILNKIENKPGHCGQTIKISNGHKGF